jgi:hypothetical protein
MPKRASEEEVAADPKRARTEGEEEVEEASGSDEELSEGALGELEECSDYDDDDEEDDGMDAEEITKDDFEGIEVTDEQLAKFKEVNEQWHKQLLEKEDSEQMVSMVLGQTTDLRPIAQTVEELETGMTVLIIPKDVHAKTEDYRTQLLQAISEIENQEDADKEMSEEEETALMRQMCSKQGDVLIALLEAAKGRVEKKDFDSLWAETVVQTNIVFDDELHQLFTELVPEAGEKVLAALKQLWDAVLSVSDEDLKISAAQRAATMTMLRLCKEDLQNGSFKGQDDAENPFAEAKFDF